MPAETLLSAARRVCRFFRIDEHKGGLTTVETIDAMNQLEKQVEIESHRQRLAEKEQANAAS